MAFAFMFAYTRTFKTGAFPKFAVMSCHTRNVSGEGVFFTSHQT